MLRLALKILRGDKAKYIGLIIGLSFAAFIITQQSAIFLGLIARTYGFVTDTSQPDIWVVDPEVQFVDDIKPLKEMELFRVRGIEGVAWAVPLYKGLIRARLSDGNFQSCNVVGIDGGTLIGGPPVILKGDIKDLRINDSIIVNKAGAEDRLAHFDSQNNKIPLQIGDIMELNDKYAKVVGICKVTRTFQSQPVIYTTFARAINFAPQERKLLSFILVKAKEGISVKDLCRKISSSTGLAAYTAGDFKKLTVMYFIKNTGIILNFGVAVFLGFIIGSAISGQTFFNFIMDNLKYLGLFKAMGANNFLLLKMTLLQVLWISIIGWGIGTGFAALFGFLITGTELSFNLPWQLYLLSIAAILLISLLSATISLLKIFKIQPAIVFK